MTAPQLRYYAVARAGQTAIIDRLTGNVAAWVAPDGARLRARRASWLSAPVNTIPTLIHNVASRDNCAP